MPDKIIYEETGTEIEFPSEPASASDLAELIVSLRQYGGVFASTHLSDQAIRRLVQIAFHLSIREDEGRFPRLRLISGALDDYRLTAKFASPLELDDVHELRRVTPAASAPDFALLVAELPSETLRCLGLANIGHLGMQSLPGRPEIVSTGGPPSFQIWIEGPGHLYLREAATVIEFRAGRVRLVTPALSAIPALREWSFRVAKVLHTKAIERALGIEGAGQYFAGAPGLSSIIKTMLSRLLASCLERRHGGAFAILPGEEPDPDTFGISCKYPLETLDIGDDLANYWLTHVQATAIKKQGVDEYDRHLSLCNRSKAQLFTNNDVVSSLSAADGCVVMTEQLRILGFGGNIAVSAADCMSATSKARLKDRQCTIIEFLNSVGGQRHQSAARLVIKYPGVIAIVISQDGELSVFATDSEGFVRAYRPVDPSFTPSAH